jgi:hypothetical protein
MQTTIKNTAVNKGQARTQIQRHDLAQYGFPCGQPITVTFEADRIIITTTPSTKKVSRVVDKRRGVTYQTIDLRWSMDDRAKMFGNAERLDVTISKNRITLRAVL